MYPYNHDTVLVIQSPSNCDWSIACVNINYHQFLDVQCISMAWFVIQYCVALHGRYNNITVRKNRLRKVMTISTLSSGENLNSNR